MLRFLENHLQPYRLTCWRPTAKCHKKSEKKRILELILDKYSTEKLL